MALASQRVTGLPVRLLTALNRAGMPLADIVRIYALPPETVSRAVSAAPEPLRIDDMELLRDDEHRYELWEGELWRMSPTKKRHGRGTTRVVRHLGRYLDTNPLGSLYVGEVGFVSVLGQHCSARTSPA